MSGFEGNEENFNNNFQSQNQGDMGMFGQNPEDFGESVEPQQEQTHNSRLEELLSSYDPNLSENEQTTFNVDVNQVVEEVVRIMVDKGTN